MLRLQEHFRDRPLLHDAALMNDGDPVAYALNHMHFMGNEHNRQIKLLLMSSKEAQDRIRGLRVKRRRRFVAQQDFRIARERSGYADPLLAPDSWDGYLSRCASRPTKANNSDTLRSSSAFGVLIRRAETQCYRTPSPMTTG